MIQLCNVCWLVLAQIPQGAAGAAGADGADAANAAAEKPQGFFDSMGFMFPALMAVMLLYFIMMAKPQQKAPVKTTELLAKLKKN